jgi:hypothetical protein
MTEQTKDTSEHIRFIKEKIISKLPDINWRILGMLLGFLVKLASFESQNKMSIQAISICFAPTLSFDPNASVSDLEVFV